MQKIIWLLSLSILDIFANESDNFIKKYQNNLSQKDYKSAKIYLLKEIKSNLKDKNKQKLEFLYNKIATIYKNNGEFYKALGYFKLAKKFEINKKKPSKIKLLKLYKEIAFCYKKIGNTFEAFKATYKATKIASKLYKRNSKTLKELHKDIEKIQSNLIASSI